MHSFLLLFLFVFSVSAMAETDTSKDTKSQLKQLYHTINASDDPYNDMTVKDEVKNQVSKSCFESASKVLEKNKQKYQDQGMSEARMHKMRMFMQKTCSCVAQSPDMVNGVIHSAQLVKQHVKQSPKARKAMRNGMMKAKTQCFMVMQQEMRQSRHPVKEHTGY